MKLNKEKKQELENIYRAIRLMKESCEVDAVEGTRLKDRDMAAAQARVLDMVVNMLKSFKKGL